MICGKGNTMVNLETKLAWHCHREYFEYYAIECPDNYLELCKEYFTEQHGSDECSKIDWRFFSDKLNHLTLKG